MRCTVVAGIGDSNKSVGPSAPPPLIGVQLWRCGAIGWCLFSVLLVDLPCPLESLLVLEVLLVVLELWLFRSLSLGADCTVGLELGNWFLSYVKPYLKSS